MVMVNEGGASEETVKEMRYIFRFLVMVKSRAHCHFVIERELRAGIQAGPTLKTFLVSYLNPSLTPPPDKIILTLILFISRQPLMLYIIRNVD